MDPNNPTPTPEQPVEQPQTDPNPTPPQPVTDVQPPSAPAPDPEPQSTEPLVKKSTDNGRPEFADEQYKAWLDAMEPFLKSGNSLYYAMQQANILTHKDSIYKKVKAEDWFSERIDAIRNTTAEMVNGIFYKIVEKVNTQIAQQIPVSEDDMKNVRFFAEKHRTAQRFFVNRNETAEAKDDEVGKILDRVDSKTDYGKLGSEIKEQGMAPTSPLQNKE